MSQGNSLCSYLKQQQQKKSFFFLLQLENKKVEQVLPREFGTSVRRWGKGERG
jgi:hypothetical protein